RPPTCSLWDVRYLRRSWRESSRCEAVLRCYGENRADLANKAREAPQVKWNAGTVQSIFSRGDRSMWVRVNERTRKFNEGSRDSQNENGGCAAAVLATY